MNTIKGGSVIAATNSDGIRTVGILQDVLEEQKRAFSLHGPVPPRDYPDGTGWPGHKTYRDMAQASYERALREGRLTWAHVFEEEVYEALAEEDPEKLVTELKQVMNVCLCWITAIQARAK